LETSRREELDAADSLADEVLRDTCTHPYDFEPLTRKYIHDPQPVMT
jgi:hypothetical protein